MKAVAEMDLQANTVGLHGLVSAVQTLSLARDLPTVRAIVRSATRELTGADLQTATMTVRAMKRELGS